MPIENDDPTSGSARRTRVTLTKDGPALIEGPVELVTDDGRVVRCDRFVVAVCTCRRSGIYPLCDTTHRRHRRKRGG
nr:MULTISPECIES: CDGSH iron-sulfur domain-containing protein [Nocardia]